MSAGWLETEVVQERNRWRPRKAEQDRLVWECLRPDGVDVEQRTVAVLLIALLIAKTALLLVGM